ncbi:predicted protein [Botrytis cinerea T4]|uniref:Uncharacterized protein n=1 Tax=Botryotinia fuckeliana (strain T4) TaxID=999810 RepID=G2YZ58_BOTF4|nr:predicted protein [Botrytis cinerea T4]
MSLKFKEAVRPASGDKDFHHEIDDKEHTIKIKVINNSISSSQMKNSVIDITYATNHVSRSQGQIPPE